MSPKSPLLFLFATILVLLISVSYIHSLPFEEYKRGAQVVGYADLLGGRVTLSQESYGATVIYGQFNTGFGDSSNPADYTFVFEPSGVVIKPSYSILNGGTSAWRLERKDVRLSPGPGTDISKDKLVVKRGANIIGSAPVNIV